MHEKARPREASYGARAGVGDDIVLTQITKIYGDAKSGTALDDVSLSIPRGSFTAIVGRSGSGKSTLLRIMAALERPTTGTVSRAGADYHRPPTDIRYVFQDYGQSLFPWRSVASNVRFGARHGGVPRPERAATVQRTLGLVGLPDVGGKYPWQLSGGMQQRVAIARALASNPKTLLMDEPFGAVDALSRANLQDMLLDLWTKLDLTVVLVTHDIDEAIYLSDRVLAVEAEGRGFCSDVNVELPRPRSQVATREAAQFLQCRRDLLRAVTGEGDSSSTPT